MEGTQNVHITVFVCSIVLPTVLQNIHTFAAFLQPRDLEIRDCWFRSPPAPNVQTLTASSAKACPPQGRASGSPIEWRPAPGGTESGGRPMKSRSTSSPWCNKHAEGRGYEKMLVNYTGRAAVLAALAAHLSGRGWGVYRPLFLFSFVFDVDGNREGKGASHCWSESLIFSRLFWV